MTEIMTEIRRVASLFEELDLTEDLERIELMEEIGSKPIELLIAFIQVLEPFRAEKPESYEVFKGEIGTLSVFLEGKMKFIWERIFTCR